MMTQEPANPSRRKPRRIPPAERAAGIEERGAGKGESVAIDALDRIQQRLCELEHRVVQAQTMASLGTAASMMAHEFNNLLAPLLSYSQAALESGDQELMCKALERCLSAGETLREMSGRVLTLAGGRKEPPASVSVRKLIDEALLTMCRDLEKDGIASSIEVPADLCVLANPAHLRQVFFNLFINARKALEGRSQGRIAVRAERKGDTAVIRFSDNGPGMPEEIRTRAFEAFSTAGATADTIASSTGSTGLGLAFCREIIEEAGGTITLASQPGEGCTFTMKFPTSVA